MTGFIATSLGPSFSFITEDKAEPIPGQPITKGREKHDIKMLPFGEALEADKGLKGLGRQNLRKSGAQGFAALLGELTACRRSAGRVALTLGAFVCSTVGVGTDEGSIADGRGPQSARGAQAGCVRAARVVGCPNGVAAAKFGRRPHIVRSFPAFRT